MENEKQNNAGLIIAIAVLVIIIIALVFGFGSYIVINNMKNKLDQQQNIQVQEDNHKEEQNNQVQEDDVKEEQKNNEQEKQEDKNESENVDTQNNVEDSKEEHNNNISEEKEFEAVKGLGDKYVNFDNRSFAVNGKVYTLGKHTLQDMINDGVPFDETDLANANNNLNKNYESQGFEIVLGKYYSAQVYFTNFSNENMKIADCKLSQIYLPVNKDKEQNILSFAFPLTITENELVSQAGKPTNESEYKGTGDYFKRTLEYTIGSTKYLGNSGYRFEFLNGDLQYLYIDYLE